MEALLDAAAQVAAQVSAGHKVLPDLALPEEYLPATSSNGGTMALTTGALLEIKDTKTKGKGYFARTNIAVGTLLMVAKPVALALDWEDDTVEIDVPVVKANDDDDDDNMRDDSQGDDDDDNGEDEPRLNELLLIRILEKIRHDPGLWERSLSVLFPRDNNDLASLPAWVVKEDDVFEKVESAVQELQKLPDIGGPEVVKEISRRLPHIIRYNILSVETCPELLSYPELGFKNLSAVGLYTAPSFFNHARHPNCNRYAVGDVMFFVANQNIAQGDEVCISYIEHDVLQESAYRRNLMLSMNFNDAGPGEQGTTDNPPPNEVDGPQYPVVDPALQNELMGMDPFERLTSLDELMAQATGAKAPQDDDGDDAMDAAAKTGSTETTNTTWFQCDIQNLRILKAITLESLGQRRDALSQWEECVVFAETRLPPNDENAIVLRVHAALSAWHAGEQARARQHADAALATHKLLFGGGTARFRRRMQSDFALGFRPELPVDPVEELWPSM